MSVALQSRPQQATPKGQRECDQVRQIATSRGGRVSATSSGGRYVVTITQTGMDESDPRLRTLLSAIEFAIRGQFDRGRDYQGMIQYAGRSRFVDVVVRCLK